MPKIHQQTHNETLNWKIKISHSLYNSVCMFIWLGFKSGVPPPVAFSPQTTNSAADHRLKSTASFSSNLSSHWLKSITSLGAQAPVNPAEVQCQQHTPHPARSGPRAETKWTGTEGGRKGEHMRLEYSRATLNSVRASGPTGTLIKYLDIFIDKLLISVLISLGKTDNFIFLSGRGMKGGGALSGV